MSRSTRGKSSSRIVLAARAQRQKQTPQEKKLWEALRNRRLAGLKFRRLHPYERFVLDMFCVEHQLGVEIDGEYHDDPAQTEYDAERTKFLEERGVRVLRFKNVEVDNDFENVLRRIVETARSSSPSDPLSRK